MDLTEEEVLGVLKVYKVTKVNRLTYYDSVSQTRKPSKTMKLYFNTAQLVENINIGFTRYKVKPFIPRPIQCYKCQKYGHMHQQCRNAVICRKCGLGHDINECPSQTVQCINCKGAHAANSKDCPTRTEKQKVLKKAYSDKITIKEAIVEVKKKRASQATKAATETKSKGSKIHTHKITEQQSLNDFALLILLAFTRLQALESPIECCDLMTRLFDKILGIKLKTDELLHSYTELLNL